MDFSGTVYNHNVVFIGLNLPYHYFLTRDDNVGKYLGQIMGDRLKELPERTLIPLKITYGKGEIRIESPKDSVNTSLAYHDIFESRQGISREHALTVVRHGVTVIHMRYPYLAQGTILSLVGLLGYLLFIRRLRRRYAGRDYVGRKENVT